MRPISEFSGLDDEGVRRDVLDVPRPAVLRNFVGHWPLVAAARRSPQAAVEILRRLDNGTPVDAVLLPPECAGRIGYDATMSGFNFVRNRLPISAVAEQVLRYSAFPKAPAVAAQSALIRDCLPGFSGENELTLLPESVSPRIWLGNAITTPAHLDEWNNIGCVAAGRRRFTLFPPEQIANLYIGPLDFAPTGAPMSLVSVHEPDFDRFPKFRHALQAAFTAELGPGDAIFIPPLWWHHVESLEPFNLLVNYWWPVTAASGFDCLIAAVLNLRPLPDTTREAWRALFEHYVFGPQSEVTKHIPPQRHGVLGHLSAADAAKVREFLARRLTRGSAGESR